ncbi:MAG TPA: glycosyltransferase family 10 [Cyclobacteriaceae bacterium]|jgi:hypothetical protein|nr:glycosyltransferase family 10 [Cyclobacteriaceae bacterium]
MHKVIVYDSDHHGAFNNRCFETSYAKEGPGHSFTVELGRVAVERGYEITTGDLFLKKNYPKDTIAFCLTDMLSKRTDLILKKGAIPFICLSTESPLIAKDFYFNIKKLAGKFIYNMQFRGTAERLNQTSTIFLPMYFPVDSRTPLDYSDWGNRKFLTLINRNKRIFFTGYSSINDLVRSLLSRIKLRVLKWIDPWIRSKEIYKDRIEAIRFFSKYSDFCLYGKDWEKRIPGFPLSYHTAALKAFKGGIPSDQKLNVLNQFKFVICFENCSFPGYVTEKIFDCFLAGAIPIYFGAPDINDFVPENTFIDFRRFKDFNELDVYLQNFSEEEAYQMLESAKKFLASKDFDKYFLQDTIKDILNRIDRYPEKL